jgi:hypothetical protein
VNAHRREQVVVELGVDQPAVERARQLGRCQDFAVGPIARGVTGVNLVNRPSTV